MTRTQDRSGSQGLLPFKRWGGWRRGAGRHKGKNSGVPHTPRERLASRFPVHVNVKLRRGLPSLRVHRTYAVIRKVFLAAEKPGFRVVHFSIQSNHVHLIVEAKDRERLSRGMQGLLIRFARAVNKLWGRVGKVFVDRYFDRILRTPRQVRNALVYVLRNHWRHRGRAEQDLDMFTSGPWFDGWKEKFEVSNLPESPVAKARTWLLHTGWWKHHGKLSLSEMTGG